VSGHIVNYIIFVAFTGYNPPPDPINGRDVPWFIADSKRQDIAPGGVILHEYPFKKDPLETAADTPWLDRDDENPTSNLIDLIEAGAFPSADPPADNKTTEPTSGSPDVYFIGVPAYKEPEKKPPDNVIVVKADINTFISGLGPGFIGLKKDSPLEISDIWGYYMKVPFFDTSVTVTSETAITDVSLECNLFGKDKTLKFGTSHNEDQFNNTEYAKVGAVIQNGNVAIPDGDGNGIGVVVCGLDTDATLDGIDLTKLLTTFRFDLGGASTISKLASKLGTLLKLKLLAKDEKWKADTSTPPDQTKVDAPVYRNAIWYFADVCLYL
jgi:hypothetical protein